ncbi:MAG: cytochrome c biogenesis protein ResB [Firmicutes bacterium]|nr:cytochrome c biogenesis protein ResB [Bacillota bacterium]
MTQNRKAGYCIISALASLQFGLVLLITIVLLSVFGTLIPQSEQLYYYQELYGQAAAAFLYYSGLTHVFSSMLFLIISLLLLINLSFCTCNRFKYLKQRDWNGYGSATLHFGLMVIIVGGLISGFFSHSKYYEVPVQSVMAVTDSGFDLRVDDFQIDYYENGQHQKQPRQYYTKLTILENEKEVGSKEIKVNHPISYKGTKVYQTSYGWLVQGNISVNGQQKNFSVPAGQTVEIAGNYYIKAIPAGETADQGFLYQLHHRERKQPFIGRANLNEQINLPEGSVQFSALKKFTGLQVKSDPGVPVVWSGFMLLTGGLFVKLYGGKK